VEIGHRRVRAGAAAGARRLAAVLIALACLLPAPDARSENPPAARTLRVATSGDYAPFSFVSTEASAPTESVGSLDGFDVEVARRFARDKGYALELVRFRWPELGGELSRGTFDVAMSGVTMRAERSISGRYSVPVAATHAVAITWNGSGVTTASDLDRPSRRVAVNAGGHLESVARRAFRRAEIVAVADNDAVRMALLDRAFDAVITDSFEEKVWTAGLKGVVRIGPLTNDRKAYLLPAARGALAEELDLWLLAREKDGTLGELRARYFGGGSTEPTSDEKLATAEPLAALSSAIVERQSLMPMVYDAKHEAGRPIEDKTQEAAVLDAGARAVADAASRNGRTAPPEPATKRLFEVLIAMGKSVQQGLADEDAKRRPGVILRRSSGSANAPDAASGHATAASSGRASDAGSAQAAGAGSQKTAPVAGTQQAPPGAAPPGAAAVDANADQPARQPGSRRIYALDTELRPALARITEKIARIVLAIDRPLSIVEVRRAFGDNLGPQGVAASQLDALSAAVSEISSHAAPNP